MNILVVDDEKEIADVIELYLKNDQYNVLNFIRVRKRLIVLPVRRLILRFWISCFRMWTDSRF